MTAKMQHISKPALLALKSSQGARDRITALMEVSRDTYYRWIRENDVRLTSASVLDIIEQETGLTREQILDSIATSGDKVTA